MIAIPAGENILFMPVMISSEEYVVSAIFFGSPRAMRASTTMAPAADAMTGFRSTSRISGWSATSAESFSMMSATALIFTAGFPRKLPRIFLPLIS